MDLIQELESLRKQLTNSIKQLRANGSAYAEAERVYKIKLREVCMRLRADGTAVGMIDKLCYGDVEVAELRFKRDIAETVYKANQEAINSIKLQMRIVENQIAREWRNEEVQY